MNITVKVNGQTVVEGDLMYLLFSQGFAYDQPERLKLLPPEGAHVELVAWVPGHGGGSLGEQFITEHDDEG